MPDVSARSTGRAGISCWLGYCAVWDASQDTFGRAGRTLVLRCFSIRSNLRMSASLFCRNMISCAREVAARLVEPAGRIMPGLRDTGFAYRQRVCRSDGVSGSKRAQYVRDRMTSSVARRVGQRHQAAVGARSEFPSRLFPTVSPEPRREGSFMALGPDPSQRVSKLRVLSAGR